MTTRPPFPERTERRLSPRRNPKNPLRNRRSSAAGSTPAPSARVLSCLAAFAVMAMSSLLPLRSPLLPRAEACDCRHADFVPTLPGFDQPTPSPWYSGYVEYPFLNRTVRTHYVLVQAEHEHEYEYDDDDDDQENANGKRKGKKKPLIYWSNGGPGASSLFGLLTELGPLQLSDDSLATPEFRRTGIPTLQYTPYAWTRLGSVLVFDQPAPVGFSYCKSAARDAPEEDDDDGDDDGSKEPCQGLSWTDEWAAENAHLALQAFYDKFPCYHGTDLFLTGESYAGIYVPTLARRILQARNIGGNAQDDRHPVKDWLRGVAVGDGCLGTQTGICGELSPNLHRPDLWRVLFLAGHGQIPFSTFQKVMSACRAIRKDDDGGSILGSSQWATDEAECQSALALVTEQVGGYYEYSLYDECIYRNLALGKSSSSTLAGGLNDYPCGGYPVMVEYLKRRDVRDALHLKGDFFSVDNAQNFDYTPTEPDLTGFFRHLAAETSVRVLIYNGDADPSITSLAGQNWTSSLGLKEAQPWRPWSVDSCLRVGGYVTRYDGDFDFLTVRGSGHMVPTYKAEATFTFIKAWIENQDYPRYDPTCTSPPNRHSAEAVVSADSSSTVS